MRLESFFRRRSECICISSLLIIFEQSLNLYIIFLRGIYNRRDIIIFRHNRSTYRSNRTNFFFKQCDKIRCKQIEVGKYQNNHKNSTKKKSKSPNLLSKRTFLGWMNIMFVYSIHTLKTIINTASIVVYSKTPQKPKNTEILHTYNLTYKKIK